jgi:multidrug efflux system membrane fusion protein
VLKLAHAGEKEVVVNAPEGQLARFKVGQEVALSLWSDPSRVFPGRIREIAGGADPVTRTYAVRVSAMSVPATAQLGMTANVLFNSAMDGKLVLLPLAAIANTRPGADPGHTAVDEPAVWVVDPKTSQVKLRRVKIGQFREDGVTITSGLEAGEVVVTAGVHKLKPDQVVRRVAAL